MGWEEGGGFRMCSRCEEMMAMPNGELLHFMICHSKKCHRPRTSSCHKNSGVEHSTVRQVGDMGRAGRATQEGKRAKGKTFGEKGM